ncbi:ISL3 family transposase [Bradyrhizobium tropiciagri]|uniref:ISL3 family transposase n=1 Tax=Bradyrhizobium tropiciagri TaxID=312253 RepID=UPI00067BBF30
MPSFEYMPQWTIEDVKQHGDIYVASGTYSEIVENCSKCGALGPLARHGSKTTTLRDAPIHGKQTTIVVRRRRYRCKACGATSLQPLPDVDDRHRMLRRCLDHIQRQCVRQPFSQIARDVGVDEKTIRLVASRHIRELSQNALSAAPRQLGISEVSALDKPRLLFADLERSCVVDLLEKKGARSLAGWLNQLNSRQTIRIVSIEMRQSYRETIRSILPRTSIMVSRRHILAIADQSFDAAVRALSDRLERKARLNLIFNWHLLTKRSCELTPAMRPVLQQLLATYPKLEGAYQAKEQFHDLYSLDSRTKAEAAYAVWLKHLPDELRRAFRPLLTAMSVWEMEVLESWEHPVREDVLVLANAGLKAVNRLGKGYSFPILRARLLFGQPFSGATFTCPGCLGTYPIEIREMNNSTTATWCPNCRRLRADRWFMPTGR